ncbi:MAG: nitroreductase family protein [Thermoplasmatota archaeon]
MDFELVLKNRRSVRSFSNFAPPERDVEKIMAAARMAPSAGNLKARQIIVMKKGSKSRALAEASGGQEFVADAPFVLVFCADLKKIEPYGERGRDLYCIQDAAASVENALLMAVNIGLAGCWVGAFDEERVREICGLPDYLRPVALIPIGYEK